MKKSLLLLSLFFCCINYFFGQELNYNYSKEELINIRKSITSRGDSKNKGETPVNKNSLYEWHYDINNDENSDEEFNISEAKFMTNGNIGLSSTFYYRSGFGDFYSANPAVLLLSSKGEELARNSFFRPGYTCMSYAPYLFENNGKLFALTTYSPEHDPLSFNNFKNYDNPPTDAILALYKLDESLNLIENYEHHFPIDTFENRNMDLWDYLPNEYCGNLYLFSALEDEGDIIGAYFKIVSADSNNPRGHDSLFLFRMNFEGKIINTKGHELTSSGGWFQSAYRRNQMVKTDSHYIIYEMYSKDNMHGRAVYYDKEFNYVTEKYIRHQGYANTILDAMPLMDISVLKTDNNITYLSCTARCVGNPHSYVYDDCRLYKFDDNIDNTAIHLSTNNYIIRGATYTREMSPLKKAIDNAPDNTLYYACNYDIEGKPYGIIEHLNSDLDTISTMVFGREIGSINSRDDGVLIVCGNDYVTKFPASTFGYEDTESIQEQELIHAVAYPNPGSDVMNIRTGLRNAILTIYDINGRKIHEQEITDEVTSIDASKWQSGTYIWKLGMRNEELGMKEVESGKWVK